MNTRNGTGPIRGHHFSGGGEPGGMTYSTADVWRTRKQEQRSAQVWDRRTKPFMGGADDMTKRQARELRSQKVSAQVRGDGSEHAVASEAVLPVAGHGPSEGSAIQKAPSGMNSRARPEPTPRWGAIRAECWAANLTPQGDGACRSSVACDVTINLSSALTLR